MSTACQGSMNALLAGAIALGTAACTTTGANISGRDIRGPIAAPPGPIGSTGSAGASDSGSGSDSGEFAPPPKRNIDSPKLHSSIPTNS